MILVNAISVYFLIMIVAAIYTTAHILSLSHSTFARLSLLLCFAVCFYILGYTMELNAGSIPQILFWNHIEYIGIPFVSALWLTIGLVYTGHFNRHREILFFAIYAVPFTTFILRFTNNYYHLYFSSVGFVHDEGRLLLLKIPGPWMYVQAVHSMLMLLATLGLFLYDAFKTGEKGLGKISLIIAATVFAVSGLLLSFIKPFGLHIDYMALCLPITCLMVSLAILRYDFIETKSIARNQVFEFSQDAILLLNRNNEVIDYNTSAGCLFEKLGMHIAEERLSVLAGPASGLLKSLMNQTTSVARVSVGQEEKYYEVSTKDIGGSSLSYGQIKTIRDITATYELNEDLKRQALMDDLSGLSNRRAFMLTGQKWMARADENGGPIHLLMLDLDKFKNINDLYGHQTGDHVIRKFGMLLKASFQTHSLVARLGGEEFAVLLRGFSDAEILAVADRTRKNLEQYDFHNRDTKFHVTVSIGIAKRNEHAQSLESLMHMADQCLYQAKGRGRNCATACWNQPGRLSSVSVPPAGTGGADTQV